MASGLQLWDMLDYGGKTYILLAAERDGKPTSEHYLPEDGRLLFGGKPRLN